MKTLAVPAIALGASLLASCVVSPPRSDPQLVRLQDERARLHSDPRIAMHAGTELRIADTAVDLLVQERPRLDERAFRHGAYLTERRLRIAEASALARYEEQRTNELARERERLLAQAPARVDPVRTAPGSYPPATYRAANDHHRRLAALQAQLSGIESRLDERGLVVTLSDYQFENGRGEPRATTQRALDSLANAMRTDPATRVAVVASEPGDALETRRAAAVRAYLATRGIAPERVNADYAAPAVQAPRGGVRLVARIDDAHYGLTDR
ncbi:MAG: hypothetical protein EOP90_04210 [Lysobacteraceae bacterium]|nr:MAG: hypothetical protein EOP90_04210 [Xanthomonadaceae bacterium]